MSSDVIWQNRLVKGNAGENIVYEWLDEQGYIVYPAPIKPHVIDCFIMSSSGRVYGIDIKCKSKRIKYNDTGFDVIDYKKYKELSEINGIPIIILFVDKERGEVYGNTLNQLLKYNCDMRYGRVIEYPLFQGECVYFNMDSMKTVMRLNDEQIERLN